MASKALKGALGNMDIDKVDDMMADIQESQDISNEIACAIARPMGFQVIFQPLSPHSKIPNKILFEILVKIS